jgi:hypothetical protein
MPERTPAAPEPHPAPKPGPAPEPTAAAAPAATPASDVAAPAAEYEHPKRKVPDNWVESLRNKLPEDSWRRDRFDTLACPVAEPTEFRVAEPELVKQLMPTAGDKAEKADRAAEILQEARILYQGAEDRAAGVTGRATTLQEAVGIAATLLIAGAGLIVGQTALQGAWWVVLFAVLLFGATLSLVMSGLRALGAASTIHQWYEPSAKDIISRSQKPEVGARVELAASLLWCYGYNSKVASWKVSYLGAAAWWYRIALTFIVSIAMLVGVYAGVQTGHGSGKPTATTATTTVTATSATHLTLRRAATTTSP